jgi:hypothetical protein
MLKTDVALGQVAFEGTIPLSSWRRGARVRRQQTLRELRRLAGKVGYAVIVATTLIVCVASCSGAGAVSVSETVSPSRFFLFGV